MALAAVVLFVAGCTAIRNRQGAAIIDHSVSDKNLLDTLNIK
jgi:hypothetical protein